MSPTQVPVPAESVSEPAATVAAIPSGVRGAFLVDAQQTFADVKVISDWFDRMAGGLSVYCGDTYNHSIHHPSSDAPSQVEELVPVWNEYMQAINDSESCLNWIWDFCDGGGGLLDKDAFWGHRELPASAVSHMEHVLVALEGQ